MKTKRQMKIANTALEEFSTKLENVVVETVESGFMTKDLAHLIDPKQPWLNTTQFLEKIEENLRKSLDI